MITERQRRIMAIAAAEGEVGVDALAERFQVTPQTIRRDLNELCDRGLLARKHGGARPVGGVANLGYDQRRVAQAEPKRRIGRAAARAIRNGSSLILNIGTTTEQVARALYDHRDLVVITNNINVVNILSGSPEKQLIIAGGEVRQSDGGVIGEAAMRFFGNYRVDFAVIGASAIEETGAVLDFDEREVAVARAIIAAARKVMLVADASKFDRRAAMRICDMADIDMLITDRPPHPRLAEICARDGVEILAADDPSKECSNERDVA